MTDEIFELLEDLVALSNRAAALGVDLTTFTDAAAKLINEKFDAASHEELARIMAAFRRPQSDAVQ